MRPRPQPPFLSSLSAQLLRTSLAHQNPFTTAGNTFVLKPSEKDPGAAMMLAELALEAGGWGGKEPAALSRSLRLPQNEEQNVPRSVA